MLFTAACKRCENLRLMSSQAVQLEGFIVCENSLVLCENSVAVCEMQHTRNLETLLVLCTKTTERKIS